MSIDREIEVIALNNASSGVVEVGNYGAEIARTYAEQAKIYALQAQDAKVMSEAWAESFQAPTSEGTRSAKSWSERSRAWAEGDEIIDNESNTRSSKRWSIVAREWAESTTEPDHIQGAKSARSWAGIAENQAIVATNKANEADSSKKSAADSAKESLASQTAAANSAVLAKQFSDSAADRLTEMKVDLSKKADVESPVLRGIPTVPKADGKNESQIVNVAYVTTVVDKAVENLVHGSPTALDTLQELSKALGDNPNFSVTITNAIAQKLDKTANAVSATKAAQDGDGNIIKTTYATKAELQGTVTSLANVSKTGNYTDLINRPTIPSKTSQLSNDSRFVQTDTSGNVVLTGTLTATKVFNAYYNDYAEFFPRGGGTLKGDIIALDETSPKEQYVQATDKSSCVVGVQSEDFAFILGGEPVEAGENILEKNQERFIPVALAGRVLVRFYGVAKVGGLVVPSEIPGVGRMAGADDDIQQAVGKIIHADNFQNVRLIKILVGR